MAAEGQESLAPTVKDTPEPAAGEGQAAVAATWAEAEAMAPEEGETPSDEEELPDLL